MLTPRKQYQPNAEFDIMFEGLTFQYICRLAIGHLFCYIPTTKPCFA